MSGLTQQDIDDWNQYAQANPIPTFGPIIAGPCVDTLLLGVILCEVVYYRLRMERADRWYMKLLVTYLFFLSVGHSVLQVQSLAFGFQVLAANFGDYSYLLLSPEWVLRFYIVEMLVVVPIELFYTSRAYHLWGKSLIVLYTLIILIIASTALGIAVQIERPASLLQASSTKLFFAWASSLIAMDWVISVLLIVRLLRSRGGFMHADRIITRLVMLSAEAQIIPSLATLAFILKNIIAPDNTYSYAFLWIPKLWIVACLIVINSRHSLRKNIEAERERRQNTFDLGLSREIPVTLSVSDPSQSQSQIQSQIQSRFTGLSTKAVASSETQSPAPPSAVLWADIRPIPEFDPDPEYGRSTYQAQSTLAEELAIETPPGQEGEGMSFEDMLGRRRPSLIPRQPDEWDLAGRRRPSLLSQPVPVEESDLSLKDMLGT